MPWFGRFVERSWRPHPWRRDHTCLRRSWSCSDGDLRWGCWRCLGGCRCRCRPRRWRCSPVPAAPRELLRGRTCHCESHEQRITFKIAVITFKVLHGAAPSYITDLIKPYTPGRLLRSSNQFLLSTSKFNLKTYGGRSFTIAAPSVWNALPFELRCCNSLLLNLSSRLGFLNWLWCRIEWWCFYRMTM